MDIIFLTEDSKINHIRHLRDELLKSSDKYMLSDYPITEEKRQEWKDYRALLRDIPNTIKIEDIKIDLETDTVSGLTFPTPPS